MQGTYLVAPRLLAPQEKLRSLGTFNERAIKEHLKFYWQSSMRFSLERGSSVQMLPVPDPTVCELWLNKIRTLPPPPPPKYSGHQFHH